MTAKQGLTLALEAGYYPLKLEFFEQGWHEGLEVHWYSGSGGGWQRIPKDALFH